VNFYEAIFLKFPHLGIGNSADTLSILHHIMTDHRYFVSVLLHLCLFFAFFRAMTGNYGKNKKRKPYQHKYTAE
jgi:hypothetical protein